MHCVCVFLLVISQSVDCTWIGTQPIVVVSQWSVQTSWRYSPGSLLGHRVGHCTPPLAPWWVWASHGASGSCVGECSVSPASPAPHAGPELVSHPGGERQCISCSTTEHTAAHLTHSASRFDLSSFSSASCLSISSLSRASFLSCDKRSS